jgi:hypothetical protein
MLEKIKKYKEIIILVTFTFGVLWAFYVVQDNASSALALAADNQKDIVANKSQMDQSIALLTSIVSNDVGKLQGFLEAMGIDPDRAQKWSRYPKEPVLDSTGNVVLNQPWVELTDNINLGVKNQVVLDSLGAPVLEVDTLWDFRQK